MSFISLQEVPPSFKISEDDELLPLFPQTIFRHKMGTPITDEILNHIDYHFENSRDNVNNIIGEGNQVLDHPVMKTLKNEILSSLDFYIKNVLNCGSKTGIKITSSWLNWTHNGQSHHLHNHQNSWLSGVLYFSSSEDDKIFFEKSNAYESNVFIKPEVVNYYTCNQITIPAVAGQLLFWDSKLYHGVAPREGNDKRPRVSLAFNTWATGEIGDVEDKNYLNLGE